LGQSRGGASQGGRENLLKTPELTYGDIPLPFGEMHTENISSTELIRAAIVEVCLSRPERYT